MRAVRHHTQKRWILLYIERRLKADVVLGDGTPCPREQGTPQGGVISPLLANLFLHYVLDCWMDRNWPDVPFARYADDAVCHCRSEIQAHQLVKALDGRFAECGLTLHPDKTPIVFCMDHGRRKAYPNQFFDFLGYTFQPRPTRTRQGTLFIGFNPAVSRKSLKAMSAVMRGWCLHRRVGSTLETLALAINPVLRGWLQYYGHFNVGVLHRLFARLELRLARWARWKYKRLRRHPRRSFEFLRRIRNAHPSMFVHWQA